MVSYTQELSFGSPLQLVCLKNTACRYKSANALPKPELDRVTSFQINTFVNWDHYCRIVRELQNAFKHPTAKLGLIFKEASCRAASSVGIGGSAQENALTCLYGKGIIGEQCILNRLADSAVDIYAAIVTLSRASRAVRQNIPSAEHELNLTKAWCSQLLLARLTKLLNIKRKLVIEKKVCLETLKIHPNLNIDGID
uniref:ACAD9/ACADV-like C-terminal domain-containing protein n=1 Tax=Glossina austeni TaxID=7395 RepID=A0A1A9V0U2_GLOAU